MVSCRRRRPACTPAATGRDRAGPGVGRTGRGDFLSPSGTVWTRGWKVVDEGFSVHHQTTIMYHYKAVPVLLASRCRFAAQTSYPAVQNEGGGTETAVD